MPSTQADLASGVPEYATFLHSGEKKFEFKDVAAEIQRQTVSVAGSKKGITSTPVVVRLFVRNALPLTLVDMPGLTRVPVGDQPADIEHRIRTTILQYIRPTNAVILAVHAANTDLATSDALQLAKSADTDGSRTVGVLTKIDLMDKGTSALDVLAGAVYPLKLGFYGVVSRSHQATLANKPITESLVDEDAFFASALYDPVRQNVGTRRLAVRLCELLASHIATHLPDVKRQLATIERDALATLQKFGDSTPAASGDKAAQGWYIMHLLNGNVLCCDFVQFNVLMCVFIRCRIF